jgi:hypothetical protein
MRGGAGGAVVRFAIYPLVLAILPLVRDGYQSVAESNPNSDWLSGDCAGDPRLLLCYHFLLVMR